jgi:hypothetical protein
MDRATVSLAGVSWRGRRATTAAGPLRGSPSQLECEVDRLSNDVVGRQPADLVADIALERPGLVAKDGPR